MIYRALEVLKSEYAIKKVTNKLLNFLNLGWNEFIEELEKQHTLFTLQQKDELNKWFREKEITFQSLEQSSKKLQESIDVEVYKLYGLSNNDIQILLRSVLQNGKSENLIQIAA